MGLACMEQWAEGPDKLVAKGVCCFAGLGCFPVCFEEPRVRQGQTNGFVKEEDLNSDVDDYSSTSFYCNSGITCGVKVG